MTHDMYDKAVELRAAIGHLTDIENTLKNVKGRRLVVMKYSDDKIINDVSLVVSDEPIIQKLVEVVHAEIMVREEEFRNL